MLVYTLFFTEMEEGNKKILRFFMIWAIFSINLSQFSFEIEILTDKYKKHTTTTKHLQNLQRHLLTISLSRIITSFLVSFTHRMHAKDFFAILYDN